jgi:hypothetical protein
VVPAPAALAQRRGRATLAGMPSALNNIVIRGGFWWPRPPEAPGRALAIPNGARVRIALTEPANPPFAEGICRDGRLVFETTSGLRTFDSAPAATAAVRGAPGDPFTCIEFLAGERWMSADAIRRSGALPWDEADELALEIATDAVREQITDTGESLTEPEIIRKAAEVVAVSRYFRDEAEQRLEWLKR